jgi:hypothetical protein
VCDGVGPLGLGVGAVNHVGVLHWVLARMVGGTS